MVIIEKVFEIVESLMITGKYIEGGIIRASYKKRKRMVLRFVRRMMFHLIASFDCKILEKNSHLLKHTEYVNTAPYKYWFVNLSAK